MVNSASGSLMLDVFIFISFNSVSMPFSSFIQPAFDLAIILAEHRWFLIALIKSKWTTRFKATAGWQIDQTGRLAGDEHRVRVTAQARNACHQHLGIRMKRRREEVPGVTHFHDL